MSDSAPLFSDGKAYEQTMGRWSRLAGAQFLEWIDPPKNARWVDVGCGNGAFTEILAARCAPSSIAGIDPSEGQLAYARTRLDPKLAQFRVGDAQALPFADNSFDAATMALVIIFVPEPIKAVAEMARVVRSGGLVASYMWDMPGGGFPLQPIVHAFDSLGLPRPMPPGSDNSRQDRMRAFWEQGGLTAVETRVFRITVSYSDFDDFWESTSKPTNPAGKVIDEMAPSVQAQYKARLRELLPVAADGRISYEAFANAVKGRVP
jgi:SAM-dependent methyltransferase